MKRPTKKQIILITLIICFIGSGALSSCSGFEIKCGSFLDAECLGVEVEASDDLMLFSLIYQTIKNRHIEDVSGTSLILAAEEAVEELVANSGVLLPGGAPPPELVASELDGESDNGRLRLFIAYVGEYTDSFNGGGVAAVNVPDEHEMAFAAIDGMFDSLGDPYSRFLGTASSYSSSNLEDEPFGGLGMTVRKRSTDNPDEAYIEVISVMYNGPAYIAGIRRNDLIIEIESQSTASMTVDEAVDLLRGRPGTRVSLEILRDGSTMSHTLTRTSIETPVIAADLIPAQDLEELIGGTASGSVGYIHFVNKFTRSLSDRLRSTVLTQLAAGAEGFIIDLRGNPGGLLESAVKAADLFFEDDPIVSLSYRYRSRQTYSARYTQAVGDSVPVVLLMNEYSASASEIFAGALHDRGRARLVGKKSYGKGTVQHLYEYGIYGASIRLTVARWYTPKGTNVHGIGIEPDLSVQTHSYTISELAQSLDLQERINDFVGRYAPGDDISDAAVEEFIEREVGQQYSQEVRDLFARQLWSEVHMRAYGEEPVYDLRYDEILRAAADSFVISP